MNDQHDNELERKCQSQEPCPVVDVHRRLRAAHRLWHQAQSAYGDPDGFCANLNACIQALRSVTWVLQKAKSKIPEFENWYGGWQSRMRADPVMRWLVDARNRIEKQGDLDSKSTVRVKVLSSYGQSPINEFDVDPLVPTHAIAGMLAAKGIPENVRKDGTLVVERRWLARDLPDMELLDGLSYAFGKLSTLVDDAHKQLGLNPSQVFERGVDGVMRPVAIPEEQLVGRMPCMLEAENQRTMHVKLASGEFGIVLKTPGSPSSPEDEAEVIRRYGLDFAGSARAGPVPLEEEAERLFDTAKRVLQTDGYHSLIVFLRFPQGRKLLQLAPADRAEKFLNWDVVAKEVEQTGADSLIVISEAWMAPFDDEHPDRPAADSPDRKEVLVVDAASQDGKGLSLRIEFFRDGQRIRFGDPERSEDASLRFLEPVRRVWRRRKEASTGGGAP